MENTASISDTDAVQAALTRFPSSESPYAAETAAGRVSRIGGRTARRVLVTDAVVLGLASVALWRLAPVMGAADIPASAGILLALLTICGFVVSSLYATVQRPNPDAIDEARRVAVSVGFAALAWSLIGAIVSERPLDGNLALLLTCWMTVTTFTTLACRRSIRRRALIADPERLLIIGAGTTAQILARRVAETSGATIVGFIDDDPLPLDPALEGIPVFDDASGLGPVIEVTGATRVVIAFSRRSATDILESIRNSRFGGIPISVVPRYFEITPAHAKLSEIDGVPLLDLHSARLSWGSRLAKRILDVTVASLGLLILSPLFLVVGIAIKATSPGSVFFGQQRTGHNGKAFRMWKFRTMVQDAEGFRMGLAHLNDMGEFDPPLQDPPRPPGHAHRARPAPLQHRRAPAAAERGQRHHEPRGPASVRHPRGRADARVEPAPPGPGPRHHRSLAGARAQRRAVRGDDPPRLHVRHQLVGLVGHPPAAADDPRCADRAGRLLARRAPRDGRDCHGRVPEVHRGRHAGPGAARRRCGPDGIAWVPAGIARRPVVGGPAVTPGVRRASVSPAGARGSAG